MIRLTTSFTQKGQDIVYLKGQKVQGIVYPNMNFAFMIPLKKSDKKGGIKMEIELRKTAIKRYLEGEPPKQIYTDLKRSKAWFFKWLKRYQSGSSKWYENQSRAPKRRPEAISDAERSRIISIRQHLESQKFAQYGPSAIKWELAKAGYGFPSDSTIKRVLKSEGLVKKNSIRSKRS